MFDKRTFIAFLLIGLVFLIWSIAFSPESTPPAKTGDTVAMAPPTPADSGAAKADTTPSITEVDTTAPRNAYEARRRGGVRYVTIETPKYIAQVNTQGGALARLTLKDYKTWYGEPVQLINDSAGFAGEPGITFTTPDGRAVDTRNLYFDLPAQEKFTLGENDSIVITARLPLTLPTADTSTGAGSEGAASGAAVEKRYVFKGNSYGIGFDVAMQGMTKEIAGGSYSVDWGGGLKYQEHNSVDESGKAQAYAMVGDELTSYNADAGEAAEKVTAKGPVKWIGTNVKYFAGVLIPKTPLEAEASLTGTAVAADSGGIVESYDLSLKVPYSAADTLRSFTLFIGPLDYDLVNEYDLTAMVDYGFLEVIVRPIAEYVLLPIFHLIHTFIPNWGLVIIVFSILIRLALWPLSIPQIKSSEKMRLVQPVINDMREKYKDDPQKLQMETMKVYREYGVNPAGGCLPMLIQLPVLYALWNTLSNAIDLRQADFGLWIHDLSIPDSILHLPFTVPLLGNQLSGLALIMGATMLVQQRMMISDPKQKALVYLMPVFLTIVFNYLPAGLNLYYFCFNLLSIGQQVYLRKFQKSSLTLEEMKKQAKGKKKGWIASKLEEAQKMAEMQGRAPGSGGGKGGKR